ncbi:MAG: hypothetical protein LBD66_02075 [Holosporales bacterium]|nr:hypothetical protein [Holosporales bacterium]
MHYSGEVWSPSLPPQQQAEEPYWLVSAQKIFSSSVQGYTNAAPCTGWRYAAHHILQDSFLKTFKKLGITYSDPVEFGIPFGAHSAPLHEKFHKKQPLTEITFYGLEPGKKKSTVIRCTKFSHCFLREMRCAGRKEYYMFYFTKISDKIIILDPKTGHPKGNSVFSYDFVKGES